MLFADDITQVIEKTDKDKEQLVTDTERKIGRINDTKSNGKL